MSLNAVKSKLNMACSKFWKLNYDIRMDSFDSLRIFIMFYSSEKLFWQN